MISRQEKRELDCKRGLAIEKLDNKISNLEFELAALKKARQFLAELGVDEIIIDRKETIENLVAIIFGKELRGLI